MLVNSSPLTQIFPRTPHKNLPSAEMMIRTEFWEEEEEEWYERECLLFNRINRINEFK